MTTDRMDLELGVHVETEGTEKLSALDKILLRIKTAQDRLNSSLGRGNTAAAQGATEALNIDRERYRVLRMRMGYESRERRQQQRDELRGIREADRAQAQADRRALSAARELTRERERGARQMERGLSRAGGGAKRLATSSALATTAATYAAKRTVDTLTRSAVTIDDAITQAQIHVFGEQDTATSRKSAMDLRKRLMPIASKLGTKTAELMGAYVEAAQAGISDDLLDTAVEQGTKYARMNKLNVPDVLEQSGYAIQGLKSFGKVTADTLKSYFDETSYIIATTSANRQELLQATKTGMAAGASVGMNRQETLAFLGSIVGVGGEGGQASRMLSTQGSRVAGWRNKGRDIIRKRHKSAEDQQFLDAVQILGYRDSDAMADAFSNDFFGSLVNVQEKIKGIKDPLKRKSITAQLFDKQFGALLDSVIMGGQLKDYRDKLNHASGFLNHNWDKFVGNLGFILDKIGVVMSNLSESMGLALKPIWTEVSEFIDRFKGFDRAGEAVRSFTDGMLRGFGADSVTTLLTRVLGDPARFQIDLRTVFLAGKGFAEGVSAVASGVKSLFSAFAGKDADAQTIGKLAGEVIALGGALTVLAPALVTLASLATIVRGLGAAGAGLAGLLGAGAGGGAAAGAAGGGAVAGAARGAAGLAGIFAKAGQLVAVGFLAEVAQHFNVLKPDASKGILGNILEEFVPAPLRRWLDGDKAKPGQDGGHWQDVGPSKRLAEMRESLTANTEALKKNTQATQDEARAAAEAKAKETADAERRKLDSVFTSIRNPAMTGSVGGGSSAADDLRRRGFNVVTPNTTPNGVTNGMPRAQGGAGAPNAQFTGDNAQAVKTAAAQLGISPKDLATVISYETGGKFDPSIRGGRGGNYQGLIQFGPAERAKYGVTGNETFAEQMPKVVRFLKDRGLKPGMGLDQLYATINGGNPYVSQNKSDGNGTIAQHVQRMQAQHGSRAQAFLDAGNSGGSSVAGAGTTDGKSVPYMRGSIDLEGQKYAFGSGGHHGANSIPAGVYPITPDTIGPWGRSHNAIGINGNRIWDAQLGRMREGIEMHSASSASMMSAGCLAILKSQYAQFRAHTLDFMKRNGRAWLKVDSNGNASITADRPDDPTKAAQAQAQKTKDLGAGINKPVTAGKMDDLDVAGKPVTDQFGNVLGREAPTRNSRDITSRVPDGPRRGGGGGSAGGPISVHIGSVHGHDGEEVGRKVGDHVRDAMNRTTHDVDPGGFA